MNAQELRTYEHQEHAAQHHLSWRALGIAAMMVGAILMIFSRGIPWISSGIPDTVMGRTVSGNPEPPMLAIGLAQLAFSLVYGLVISLCIFRFRVSRAIPIGIGISLLLYGLNYLVFHHLLRAPEQSEVPVVLSHVVFGLFFSTAYKALSVPRVIPDERPADAR